MTWKVFVLYCQVLTGTSLRTSGLQHGPPDAAHLRLVDVAPRNFTVTWKRPQGSFDFYWIEMVHEKNGSGGLKHYRLGSCANGTLLPANETRVTCSNFATCAKVSFTLHTLIRGPPERSSRGVTIEAFYVPGKVPEPPSKISSTVTTVGRTSSVLLDWNGSPESTSKCFAGYWVKVCEPCASADIDRCCWAEKTFRPSLAFNITSQKQYRVEVSSGVLYGRFSMWSLPAHF
ncbi:uncharacterized protein LOC144105007 [Amblyomma americanum]